MKKIVAIIGSPKPESQSVTYALVADFIDSLKKDGNIDAVNIHISAKNILPCKGCLVCKKTGQCVLDDDMESIRKSMSEADLLIFGSPVHFTHVSSVFQNFIERSIVPLHTFEYLGKPFVTAVTTNGSGEQEADKYLSKVGYLFGCIKIGAILKSDNDKFNEKAYGKLIVKTASVLAGAPVRPSIVNKIYFSSMRKIIRENKDYFVAESKIWEKRNWFGKSYNEVFISKKNAER